MTQDLPVFALPIDTGLALVFARRSINQAQLDELMRTPAASLGLSKQTRRVVLPPELPKLPTVEKLLRVWAQMRELFGLYNEMEKAIGLVPKWALDPE